MLSAKFRGVTPNLMNEDAEEAIVWLERVLGFEERARYVDRDGVVKQAEVFAGDTEIWLSGHGKGPLGQPRAWSGAVPSDLVNDVDAQYERVTAAGGRASSPIDQTWGVRNFYVKDPGGYN